MTATTTLDRVLLGSTVMVVDVGDDSAIHAQLASRGILPGAVVTMMNCCDPVVVGIDECRWAISKREARAVVTVPLSAGVPDPAPAALTLPEVG